MYACGSATKTTTNGRCQVDSVYGEGATFRFFIEATTVVKDVEMDGSSDRSTCSTAHSQEIGSKSPLQSVYLSPIAPSDIDILSLQHLDHRR